MKKAVSVLSGGLDCCVASSVFAEDYEVHAITFNYGQKSFDMELKAAREICDVMGFEHSVVDLDWLSTISDSSLNTSKSIPNPSESDLDDIVKSRENADSVWVPGRNMVFTSIAVSFAESIGAGKIIVGWDKEEAETFPDNSREFLESFNNLISVGSPDEITVEAPAIDLNKDEIVKLGVEVNAPMDISYSCYEGGVKHCGVCESCMRRKRAFIKAGVEDLTEYEK